MNAKRQTVNKYVARIRNPEKKRYATDWANYAIGFQPHPEDHHSYNLSYMAKQAVRMQIGEILGEDDRS